MQLHKVLTQILRHENTGKDTNKDPKDPFEECKIKLKLQIQTQIEYDKQMQQQIKLTNITKDTKYR